jgi:cellulose biosynthesis protein BcsQ
MTKIVVCHSRKGGVGKSTIAYELAWLLAAPLIDLDWEEGGVSRTWGYRWEERTRVRILARSLATVYLGCSPASKSPICYPAILISS